MEWRQRNIPQRKARSTGRLPPWQGQPEHFTCRWCAPQSYAVRNRRGRLESWRRALYRCISLQCAALGVSYFRSLGHGRTLLRCQFTYRRSISGDAGASEDIAITINHTLCCTRCKMGLALFRFLSLSRRMSAVSRVSVTVRDTSARRSRFRSAIVIAGDRRRSHSRHPSRKSHSEQRSRILLHVRAMWLKQ